MSQAAIPPLPPAPAVPSGGARSRLRIIILVSIGLGLFAVLELRLVNSAGGKEAARRICSDARVRAQFGSDVHISFAVAWAFIDRVGIYAYISGSKAQGYADVDLIPSSDGWAVFRLEVHNPSEGYMIDLSAPEEPARTDELPRQGSLYFVALGTAANADVKDLANFIQKGFGIPVTILDPLNLPPPAYDERRKQWVAEMLVQAMMEKYSAIAADPDSQIVGILEDDAYIRGFRWSYTFSYRWMNKYSVIPTVRLDPGFYQFPPSPGIRMERLRKVAMKAVALLDLKFNESADPRSVDAIESSTYDIDRMGSIYLASDVPSRPANQNANGRPCLTFFTVNVGGTPVHKPIVPCSQQSGDTESSQYQIDLASGKFQVTRNDLYRGGPIPLFLQRMNFSSRFDDKVRAFGKNSWQNLDDTVWSADPNSIQTISIYGTLFKRTTPGRGFSTAAQYRAGPSEGVFSYALLSWENNGWRIDTRDGEIWRYLGCGPTTVVQCYYMGKTDAAQDGIEVQRDLTNGHLQQVSQKTNPDLPSAKALDHTWTPTYDGDKITAIRDSDGRSASYRYDHEDYLTDVQADGHHLHYSYDDKHRITEVIEDQYKLGVHYNSEGRADRVDFPNGSGYSIRYDGENADVEGPGQSFTVTVQPTFFRTVENSK